MGTDVLSAILSGYPQISEDFRAAFERELIPLSLPRNHILLEAPNIATHAYYLENGFAMSYTFLNGKKITENFWKAGQVAVAFESFFEQKPAREYIQLMQKTEVRCISHRVVEHMMETYPEAQRVYRALMNRHYADTLERLRDMQQLSAYHRYKKVLTSFRDIELIVPQEAIASYIGVTPQSLARLKRSDR